jgi:hypothetical protein
MPEGVLGPTAPTLTLFPFEHARLVPYPEVRLCFQHRHTAHATLHAVPWWVLLGPRLGAWKATQTIALSVKMEGPEAA